jgi:hypothetical protein
LKIQPNSTLQDVAFAVCTSLERINVTAVLTGGSAATIWSSENYQSHDCDFVITFEAQSAPSGQVLKELGFTLHGQVYRHSASPFTLDFLRTPLSVGNEIITDW